jgi:hypothetical protein
MLGFLHIIDPVLSVGSDKTEIKPSSSIVKEIQVGSQGIREQVAGDSDTFENLPVST